MISKIYNYKGMEILEGGMHSLTDEDFRDIVSRLMRDKIQPLCEKAVDDYFSGPQFLTQATASVRQSAVKNILAIMFSGDDALFSDILDIFCQLRKLWNDQMQIAYEIEKKKKELLDGAASEIEKAKKICEVSDERLQESLKFGYALKELFTSADICPENATNISYDIYAFLAGDKADLDDFYKKKKSSGKVKKNEPACKKTGNVF